MTLQLNLDTRREAIGVTIDLDEAAPLIPLVIFDAPDDLRQPARLSLVSLEGRASHRAAGWSDGGSVSEEIMLQPKGQATLAVSRDWLAERVAVMRAQGEGSGDGPGEALVELAFSTILHLPRAPRASARRLARIVVAAGASRPAAVLQPATLDLDNLPATDKHRIGTLLIEIPSDIALEADRTLLIEASCAGLPADSLAIEAGDALPGAIALRRVAAAPQGKAQVASRHRLSIERPEDLAGQRLSLALTVDRQALLAVIDGLLADSQGAPSLRLAVKVMGWGEAGAPLAPDRPDRRFVLAPPAVAVLVESREAPSALIAIGDTTLAATFDGEGESVAAPALVFEIEPEAQADVVRHPGLKLAILRWPLGRAGALEIEAEAIIAGERVREPAASLRPSIERAEGRSRQGHIVLALRATVARLADRVRSGTPPRVGEAMLSVTLSSGGRRLLEARMPIVLKRAVRRMPICIDWGASAISIWAGPARGEGEILDMRPLPIGSWLAANVDPSHEEADTLDGEAALLIPGHVGLDPNNNLRSDHAPHSLRTPDQIGSGRQAAKARMAHFGRRYDVSTPAPPPAMRGRGAGRRIAGLKHALATGRQSIALAEPVNRYDAGTGKLSTTAAIDVAPLAADMLDELVDLYVMRLGQEEGAVDGSDADPAPVVPRVVITCPSGIGGEVQARYAGALGLFAKRLDRLFPGSSSFEDAALALPEAVAAARYAAQVLAPEMAGASGEPLYLVTLDLGAGTSDAAIARLVTQDGRLQSFEPIATFGLSAGGDTIDEALLGIAAPLVDALLADERSGWTAGFEGADLGRALASDESSGQEARRWLQAALRRAKAELSDALLRNDGPYRWPRDGGPTLDIDLAAQDGEGFWRGLCRPTGSETPPDVELGEHARACVLTDAEGKGRLVLRLGRGAIENESAAARRHARVVAALGINLQRMARSAVPAGEKRPRVFVAPTGRAALWPPLFETLASEAARGRDGFPMARPMTAALMKKAVVAGAALLSSRAGGPASGVERRCPLGLAVTGAHLAEGPDGALKTGAVAERVLYLGFDLAGRDRTFAAEEAEAASLAARADLGRRFQFVRAAPGLDPQGRMLAELRQALGSLDPVSPLEGDVTVEARAERIDRFGICEVESRATGPDSRRVTITARDRDWEGVWDIEGDRVSRLRSGPGLELFDPERDRAAGA